MSKLHLYEFSALLQAQRQHLLEDVRKTITASGERLGSASRTKIAEGDPRADAVSEMDVATAIRESREMRETEAALARIRDGSYGICIDCGVGLSRASLKADPTSTRCPRCQTLVLTILPTGER
jgi:DnaK suppressor protein